MNPHTESTPAMMDAKSHAQDLFDEDDATYNPPLSLAQLHTTAPDPKLAELGKGVLVRCVAKVTEGNFIHEIPYFVVTEKPEDILFTTGPTLTTALVSTKPLTPDEQRVLEVLLSP